MVKGEAYFFSYKMRAPQAEHLNIAGPLNPQCVINNAPRVVTESIFKVTFSTDTPASPSIRLSFTLNVNNEGTGSAMECPSDLTIARVLESLPVAINNFLVWIYFEFSWI